MLFAIAEQVLRLASFAVKNLVMLSCHTSCGMQEEILHSSATHSAATHNHYWLWLHHGLSNDLRLHHRLGLHHWLDNHLRLHHWLRLDKSSWLWLHNGRSNHANTFSKVVEDDLSELNAFLAVKVHEFESDSLGVSVEFRECESEVGSHAKLKSPESNLSPAAFEWMPLPNIDLSRRLPRVVTSTSERNAFEHESLRKFDFDP